MADKFHVLLVEHDSNNHDKTLKMLHYYSYEVTSVKLASNALSILSKEKVKFDLVMANLDSPDSCGLELLQDVVKRDLLLILMSNDDNSAMITSAIEQGAFLCIKKPVTMQIVGYLWQHVLREKVRRNKENERTLDEVIEYNNIQGNQEFGNLDGHIEGYNLNNNNDGDAQARNKSKQKANTGSFTLQNDNVVFKKKVWAEWSEELHQKFMVAAIQLGEGRCYPKEILELMNVPGLTRMQVASHLQKCRNAKWLPHGGRKYKPINTETNDPNKLNKVRRSKTERFGSMPHLDNYSQLFHLTQKSEQEMMNHHKFIETGVLENSNELFLPQLMLDHRNNNYPLSVEHIETFNNMGHLGQTFGMDDVTDATPSDDVVTDDVTNSMFQMFSSLQHELGTEYYNGSLQSLVVNASAVNLNHMPMKTNAAAGEWNGEPESMNEEQI